MKYARPPFPHSLFAKFTALATALGWGKRGDRWKMLELLLDYADLHPSLFRKR